VRPSEGFGGKRVTHVVERRVSAAPSAGWESNKPFPIGEKKETGARAHRSTNNGAVKEKNETDCAGS